MKHRRPLIQHLIPRTYELKRKPLVRVFRVLRAFRDSDKPRVLREFRDSEPQKARCPSESRKARKTRKTRKRGFFLLEGFPNPDWLNRSERQNRGRRGKRGKRGKEVFSEIWCFFE